MRYALILALLSCGSPSLPCADMAAPALDLAPLAPPCLPCSKSLPAVNCAPSVCVKQGEELCCLPTG